MSSDNDRLRLHIDNASALGDIFEITRDRYAAACERHMDIARNLDVSFGYDGAGFDEAVRRADVLFAWNFDHGTLATHAPNLQLIQIQGAGINHLLPLDWVPPHVTLTNSSGAHGARATEYLVMSMLALNCALPSMTSAQRERRWDPIHTSSIEGKTLLIYGVGTIGGELAAHARRFGVRVIGVRRSGDAHPDVAQMITPEGLHEVLPKADFIVITAPHTRETEHAFGEREFEMMKDGAGIVVYSRSKLVDFDALLERLRSGKLRAIVDVFDEEPLPPESDLWAAPNLIITPHSSSNDPERHAARSLDVLFENIRRLRNGESLLNVVDPVLQY